MANKKYKVQVIRRYSVMKVFDVEVDENETRTEAMVRAEQMMSNSDNTSNLQIEGDDETCILSPDPDDND